MLEREDMSIVALAWDDLVPNQQGWNWTGSDGDSREKSTPGCDSAVRVACAVGSCGGLQLL